jgi:catechol 2,3-dioxygenase-like lactoylglutathione lyase family enzyme
MKLEHIAVSANTEEQSDKFFVDLLGLTKVRSLSIAADLTRGFFGVDRDIHVVRYGTDSLQAEVFITEDNSRAQDLYTHNCLIVDDRDAFESRARSMGLDVVHLPKKGSDTYYLFVKDFYGNIYEIK